MVVSNFDTFWTAFTIGVSTIGLWVIPAAQ
jgi:hypothetical protein